jgi:hypothetical protein
MQHSASSTSNTTGAHTMQQQQCTSNDGVHQTMSKAGASITSLTHRPPSPNASNIAPSCCRRTRRAIPSPPPSCSPRQAARARPGRDLVACAITRSTRKAVQARHRRPPVRRCHKPPTTSRLPLPRLALHCIAAHRILSTVASRRLSVANPAGRAARTAINMQARALRARPQPRYRLLAPINSPASLAASPRTSQALPSLSPELPPPPSQAAPVTDRPPSSISLHKPPQPEVRTGTSRPQPPLSVPPLPAAVRRRQVAPVRPLSVLFCIERKKMDVLSITPSLFSFSN